MKRLKWIGLATLALLAGCATAAPPAPKTAAPKPGLWKLADKDTTIYLFGTIHVLPSDFDWRTPKFDAAAAASQSLVLEVADLDDQTKTAATLIRLASSPGLPPVLDRVPQDKRARLGVLIDKTGLPLAALNQFESWAVAITLASSMLKDLDVSPDNGVERQLTTVFRNAKKPVEGLETTAQQLGFFDSLSEASQRLFLVSMVEESSDMKEEFERMTTAWVRGDDKAIALTFDDELKLSAELSEVLLRQRNRNWTGWLEKRLDKPGTTLVAVGAGHLAGPDSVIAMLKQRGFKAKRIQ